jgi:hypothetical protein
MQNPAEFEISGTVATANERTGAALKLLFCFYSTTVSTGFTIELVLII